MKKIFVVLVLLCLIAPAFAGTLKEDRQALKELEMQMNLDHAVEIQEEKKVEDVVTAIVGGINIGMAIWGFSQGTTYGTVTGMFFTLRFGGNVAELSR